MQFIQNVLRFFDTQWETPQLYGGFHIACLIIMFAAAFVLCALWKAGIIKNVRRVVLVTAIIVGVLEIYKQINFSFGYEDGITFNYQWYAFPWQFCSTPLYVGLLAGLSRGKVHKMFTSYLATYALFAGLAVMLYPGDVFIGTVGICIQTMVCHGSMVTIAIFLYYTGHVETSWKTLLRAIPVFATAFGVAIGLNELAAIIGITEEHTFNMFYVSRHFDSTLPVYSIVHNALMGKSPVLYPICLIIYIVGFTAVAAIMLLIAKGIKKLFTMDFDAEYREADRIRLAKESLREERIRSLEEKQLEEELAEKEEKNRKKKEKKDKKEAKRAEKKRRKQELKEEKKKKKEEKESAEQKEKRLKREERKKKKEEKRKSKKEKKLKEREEDLKWEERKKELKEKKKAEKREEKEKKKQERKAKREQRIAEREKKRLEEEKQERRDDIIDDFKRAEKRYYEKLEKWNSEMHEDIKRLEAEFSDDDPEKQEREDDIRQKGKDREEKYIEKERKLRAKMLVKLLDIFETPEEKKWALDSMVELKDPAIESLFDTLEDEEFRKRFKDRLDVEESAPAFPSKKEAKREDEAELEFRIARMRNDVLIAKVEAILVKLDLIREAWGKKIRPQTRDALKDIDRAKKREERIKEKAKKLKAELEEEARIREWPKELERRRAIVISVFKDSDKEARTVAEKKALKEQEKALEKQEKELLEREERIEKKLDKATDKEIERSKKEAERAYRHLEYKPERFDKKKALASFNEYLDFVPGESKAHPFLKAYFENLTQNFGTNDYGTCGYVAIAMMLSYYDTFLDDNIVPERYDAASKGEGYDMLERRNSPGTRRDNLKEKISLGNYFKYIKLTKGISLHSKLMSMVEIIEAYSEKELEGDLTKGTDFVSQTYIIEKYLSEVLDLERSKYEIDGIYGAHIQRAFGEDPVDPSLVSQAVRNFAIKKVQDGIPVVLGVYNSQNEGHAIVAYDYDAESDKLYCHFGWNEMTAHITVEEEMHRFDIYCSAIALEFKNRLHRHSDNYEVKENRTTKRYCFDSEEIITYIQEEKRKIEQIKEEQKKVTAEPAAEKPEAHVAESEAPSAEPIEIPTEPQLNVAFVRSFGREGYTVCGLNELENVNNDVIIIPSTHMGLPVLKIGDWAFDGCAEIERAIVCEGVTTVGLWAFGNCASLKEIYLPAGLSKLESTAFDGCTALELIEFGGSQSEWRELNKSNYWYSDLEGCTVRCNDGEISNDQYGI